MSIVSISKVLGTVALVAVASFVEPTNATRRLGEVEATPAATYARQLREASDVEFPWDDSELVSIKRRLENATTDGCAFKPSNNLDCPVIDGVRQCVYCPFTKCWSREGATFKDSSKCNKAKPEEKECAELSEPFPVPCPDGLEIKWDLPTTQIKQGESFNITTHLDFGSLKPIKAPCNLDGNDNIGEGLIPHANVHGCVKTATTWWCSELVPAFQPKSVLTSPTQCFNNTRDNVFNMEVATSTLTPPNEWTLYAHYYFYTGEIGNLTKWHITIGSTFLIEGRQLELRPEIATTVFALQFAVLTYSVITGLLVVVLRKHWVMVASSVSMCMLTIFGGFLGAASVFAFDPTRLNDMLCTMRLWFLPLAFDFIVVPMCLKTWRVHKLFSSSFSRVRITNKMLLIAFAVVLVIEAMFNTAFMIVAPLKADRRFSQLDGNAWEPECIADDPYLANIFTSASILLHLIPCLALTFFAYRVRLSFKYSRVNRKLWEFDESLYIMLSLLNLTVVGLFVIIFQAVIESNPESVTMMRTGGIAWIVAVTLGLMFIPKFVKVYTWDPEAKIPEAGSVLGVSSQSRSESSTFTRSNALKGQNPQADMSGYINTLALQEEEASSSDEEEKTQDWTDTEMKNPVYDDYDYSSKPSVRTVVPSSVGPPRRPSPPSFLARLMGHSRENSAASAHSQVDVQDGESLLSLTVSEANLVANNPMFVDTADEMSAE